MMFSRINLKKKILYLPVSVFLFAFFITCKMGETGNPAGSGAGSSDPVFRRLGTLKVGTSEIAAYDPETKRLFVTGNNAIEVIDFSKPAKMSILTHISLDSYSPADPTCIALKKGLLAVAVPAGVKVADGKVVVFNSKTYAELASLIVGALPDMVTFTPDGNYILCANEGEPDGNIDPAGSVSIITINSWAVDTLRFSGSAIGTGFRVLTGSIAEDAEPEYITVSGDSETAWVSLQENNGIAKIDIGTKAIIGIYGLGYKEFIADNQMDLEYDTLFSLESWPHVYGMYQPDGVASYTVNGTIYIISANEGDFRNIEVATVEELPLSKAIFDEETSNALSELEVTKVVPGTSLNAENEYTGLYTFGARSFSIRRGEDLSLVYDSKNDLEKQAAQSGIYLQKRAPKSGTEPENVTVGQIDDTSYAFVGLERAHAVAVYNIQDPEKPYFVTMIRNTVDEKPEGLLFIPAADSPTGKALIVVGNEGTGTTTVYESSK